MKVFVTGASGFVGSVVVRELVANGYQVLGLARSDESAAAITVAGADVLRGSLDDLDSLRKGAESADAVIHCAFVHNFTDYAAAAEADRVAIETLGSVLAGSDRRLIVTSGMGAKTEDDEVVNPPSAVAARVSEKTALELAAKGIHAMVIRLPPVVHGKGDYHGFVPRLIATAREKGVSAYPGEGLNHWPAVHRLDAAHLYRLGLEKASAGARLHAVGDEGVPVRDIAEVIGRQLNLPVVSIPVEKAPEHFGFIGMLLSRDILVSNKLTQERFDWHPAQPGLIADLDDGHYFKQ